MSVINIPAYARATRRLWLPGICLAVLISIIAGYIAWRRLQAPATVAAASTYYHVIPMDLVVRIQKDGELEAVHNIDVACQVEGETTLLEVVPEGTRVHKGDLLARLDGSAIQEKCDDTRDLLQSASDDLTNAIELEKIQQDQNAANLQAAQVAVDLAKIDKDQYINGTYPQMIQADQNALDMAKLTLKTKQDVLDRTRGLYAKGFVTGNDIKSAELDVTTAVGELQTAQTALDVLRVYTHQMDLETKESALSQAEQNLERTRRENASALNQKHADREAKQEKFDSTKRLMDHTTEQLADCTISAPSDGMVIYETSTDRDAQESLQAGMVIHNRQVIIRLPDDSSMKDVVRIPEQMAGQIYVGQRAIVHVLNRDIGATVTGKAPMPDNSQHFWNPDLKEYPVDLTLDQTPSNLVPGMTAPAQVLLDQISDCVAAPLAAVYASGTDHYVFVRGAGGAPRPIAVTLGKANETHVQIKDGLESGQDVLLLASGQGRQLLEDAGIKVSDVPNSADNSSTGDKSKRHAAQDQPTTEPATPVAVTAAP